MNFNFKVNEVFPREIMRVRSDLIPADLTGEDVSKPRPPPPNGKHFYNVQQNVSRVLDEMGVASANAQGLNQPITSGTKIRNHPEHVAYILRDETSIVGLLKVGRKNLFLLDRRGEQNEMYPLCILDFYVHESRQRSGIGKRLFDAMLHDQNIQPKFLAVDRPSPKLVSFLRKHFNLCNNIPQVNNYYIYDGFFQNRPDDESLLKTKRPRIYMGKLQYV